MTELDELLKAPGAELARGTFNDAVVVPGRWVARFPRTDLPDARRRAQALRRISRLDLPFAVPEIIEDRLDLPVGRAHVVVTYLPGEPSDTATEEAVSEVLDALAEVELDPELVALLDEPLHHAGGPRAAETITELCSRCSTMMSNARLPKSCNGLRICRSCRASCTGTSPQ